MGRLFPELGGLGFSRGFGRFVYRGLVAQGLCVWDSVSESALQP